MIKPEPEPPPPPPQYSEMIADLCEACITGPGQVKAVILAQPSPLRAAIVACGAAATMDFELRWRLFRQLIEIASNPETPA